MDTPKPLSTDPTVGVSPPNAIVPAPPNNSVNPVTVESGPAAKQGEPLTKEQLITAMLGSYDSYNAAAFKLPPFNPDALIASKGFDAIDDMMTIAPCRNALNILRNSALAKGWTVQPHTLDQKNDDYTKAQELAEALTYDLTNITDEWGNEQDFRQVIWEMLYAIHSGFTVTEINWVVLKQGLHAGKLGFTGFDTKKCRQIGFDVDPMTFHPRRITSYTPSTGYNFDIPIPKVLRYTFQPNGGLPHGNGIGRAGYKHTWSINLLTQFWNIGLEMFGGPFILGKAPAGLMELARAALAEIRQGAPAVLPEGTEAQLIQMTGNGLTAFRDALDHHGQQLALVYLGSTLTTGEGARVGSLALGNVHQDTQAYTLAGVRNDVEGVLNLQLVKRWVVNNYGEEFLKIMPKISLGVWDAVDMQGMAGAFGTLIDKGVMHPDEPVIRDRMNVPPMPKDLVAKMEEKRQQASQAAANASNPAKTDDNSDNVGKTGPGQSGKGKNNA